ncbi:hypothetical protein C8A03DRAFT_39373, partial [Achaetomium macrosporum]
MPWLSEVSYSHEATVGVIYWLECPGSIRHNPTREPIQDDSYDYAPSEGEAEWRGNPAWAVADFLSFSRTTSGSCAP